MDPTTFQFPCHCVRVHCLTVLGDGPRVVPVACPGRSTGAPCPLWTPRRPSFHPAVSLHTIKPWTRHSRGAKVWHLPHNYLPWRSKPGHTMRRDVPIPLGRGGYKAHKPPTVRFSTIHIWTPTPTAWARGFEGRGRSITPEWIGTSAPIPLHPVAKGRAIAGCLPTSGYPKSSQGNPLKPVGY